METSSTEEKVEKVEKVEKTQDEEFYPLISKTLTVFLAFIFYIVAPISMSLVFEMFATNVINYYIFSLLVHCSSILLISVVLISIFRHIDLDPAHPLRRYRILPLPLFEAQKHYAVLSPSLPRFYKILMCTTAGLYTFFFWMLYFLNRLSPAYSPITFSSLLSHIFLLSCTFVTTDFWYFILHRLYHHPWLYKYLHKTHHEYKNVTVLTNFHASIIEYIFFDIPIYNFGWLTLLYLGFPIHTSLITLSQSAVLLDQLFVHSGYCFPFGIDKTIPYLSEPRFHFYHHKMSTGSYGALFGIFDRIFGSYKIYHQKHN